MCSFCGTGDAPTQTYQCPSCTARFDICSQCEPLWFPCERCKRGLCAKHMKHPQLCIECWTLFERPKEWRALLKRRSTQVVSIELDPFGAGGITPDYVEPIVIHPRPVVQTLWLKLGDLAPCTRLYFAYDRGFNQSTVYELLEACNQLGKNFQLPEDTGASLLQCCSGRGSFVQLVELQDPREDFIFMQDQFIIGCRVDSSGGAPITVAQLCRRKLKGPLATWARQNLPQLTLSAPTLLLEDDLTEEDKGDDQNSVEFGGNFLLSPPVLQETGPLAAGPAGPPVPGHPMAPYGKIIVGDARHPEKECPRPELGMGGNSLSQLTRRFFCENVVQPVVAIDTSWLLVAHTDEIISFAQGSRGTCLSVASPRLMHQLLTLLQEAWPKFGSYTCFHAGKFKKNECEEGTPEHLLGLKDYNVDVHENAMVPIIDRLQRTLCIPTEQIIELPVWFEPIMNKKRLHQTKGHAHTIDLVNMIVLPQGVIVPRPYGPRMPYDLAAGILRSILKRELMTRPDARPICHWTRSGDTLLHVAAYFAPCSPELYDQRMQLINLGTEGEWSSGLVDLARQIAGANRIRCENEDDLRRALGIRRLIIPFLLVDIVEWLVVESFAPHGIVCQFADDWIYHLNCGELHCGSNSVRTPPDEWSRGINLRLLQTCGYDETTVAPPIPVGVIEFANGADVMVRYQDRDVPGKVLGNRQPKDPVNDITVRLEGFGVVVVPKTTVTLA